MGGPRFVIPLTEAAVNLKYQPPKPRCPLEVEEKNDYLHVSDKGEICCRRMINSLDLIPVMPDGDTHQISSDGTLNGLERTTGYAPVADHQDGTYQDQLIYVLLSFADLDHFAVLAET